MSKIHRTLRFVCRNISDRNERFLPPQAAVRLLMFGEQTVRTPAGDGRRILLIAMEMKRSLLSDLETTDAGFTLFLNHLHKLTKPLAGEHGTTGIKQCGATGRTAMHHGREDTSEPARCITVY